LLACLQKFPGGEEVFDLRGEWVGTRPFCDLWALEGPRNSLVIYPRGTYKTSCNMSHTIQWIINYPDVRILWSMATGTQVTETVQAILGHFRFNATFRELFPEFCPPAKSARDFGSNEGFTVPNRVQKWLREPTLFTASLGKVMSGNHHEVIKHSDVVDKENVKTPFQVQEVKNHFGYCNFLLHRGGAPVRAGWQDTEGTFYDFSDAYMEIVDKHSEDPDWKIIVRPPYNADGSLAFPRTLPQGVLERIKKQPGMSDYIYSCQILLKPVAAGSGLATAEEILFVPRKVVEALRPQLRIHTTIDLSGMDPQATTTDFVVLTTGGFDRDGRFWVIDMRVGRFDPFTTIEHIFDIHKRYRPIDMKIERDAHARVLGPFFERERSKRQEFPNLVPIQRDNRTAKKQRIKSLQPWFKMGIIRFADDLPGKLELIHEITRFSDTSTYHDDILDTLADQMQNQEGGVVGDVVPDAPRWEGQLAKREITPKFLGFGQGGKPIWSNSEEDGAYDRHTGL